MAGLLQSDTSHDRNSLRPLLLSGLVVAIVLAAAFALYYRQANHAAVELTGLRSITVPLHTVFTHTGRVLGPDTAEDSTYVVAAVRLTDRADIPLFVKDMTAGLTVADGSLVEATRVKDKDIDRLLQLVPTLRPAMLQVGAPPLRLEQTVAPHATVDGYIVLQINGPEATWTQRRQATLTVDFYHQDPVMVTLR